MGTFLGVPIIRTIVFWGLYWGSPILGNYHMDINGKENGDYYVGFGVRCLGLTASDLCNPG